MFSSTGKTLVKIAYNQDEKEKAGKWGSLPKDVIVSICSSKYLDNPKHIVNLAYSCHYLYHSTSDLIFQYKLHHYAKNVVVQPFIAKQRYMVRGMKFDPSLLNAVVKEVKDGSGYRVILNKTLYQLAYGAGDDDLCELMKDAFIFHYGSEEAGIQEMNRQRDEILESEEEYLLNEAACLEQLQTILQPIITAINEENFNVRDRFSDKYILDKKTVTATETFSQSFAELQQKYINKGVHFRFSLLLEVLSEYGAYSWRDWNREQCRLFQTAVIAEVQKYVPANDAMKFTVGLFNQSPRIKPASRELSFKQGKASFDGENNYYKVIQDESCNHNLNGNCVNICRGTYRARGEEDFDIKHCYETLIIYLKQKYKICKPHLDKSHTPTLK